jgi:hypothetical protein
MEPRPHARSARDYNARDDVAEQHFRSEVQKGQSFQPSYSY